MPTRRPLLAALLSVSFLGLPPLAAEARTTRAWSYSVLYDGADLVVIATPTATRMREEQAQLPDIQQTDKNGKTGPVMAQRVETELRVVVVLKGKAQDAQDKATKTILLHHYTDIPNSGPSLDGPGFVAFDPKDRKQYLMFLKRGKNGQYVAVSGQTDPHFSIEELRDRDWRRG